MNTSFLWPVALWLLEWAGVIGLSGLALLVAANVVARIAAETWRRVSIELEMIIITLAEQVSEKLAVFIVEGIHLCLFLIQLVFRTVFWSLRVLLRLVKKHQPQQEAPKPPPPQSGDPLKEARDILGLRDEFSAADLKARHRELMKRVHTDVGGTDWLAQRVNWAHDILKASAAR